MDHPKDVGDRCTLAVMLALRLAGYGVLVPFGENTRYDLVIDDGKQLSRVQCKTDRLGDGAVRFPTCSTYGHHLHPSTARRHYKGQIDYFAVHCPETAGVYLIPIAELSPSVNAALRVTPARNGQVRRIRPAADYQIATVDATAEPDVTSGAGGSSA
jgi:PD-(D/E)XK endonuclease